MPRAYPNNDGERYNEQGGFFGRIGQQLRQLPPQRPPQTPPTRNIGYSNPITGQPFNPWTSINPITGQPFAAPPQRPPVPAPPQPPAPDMRFTPPWERPGFQPPPQRPAPDLRFTPVGTAQTGFQPPAQSPSRGVIPSEVLQEIIQRTQEQRSNPPRRGGIMGQIAQHLQDRGQQGVQPPAQPGIAGLMSRDWIEKYMNPITGQPFNPWTSINPRTGQPFVNRNA